MRSSKVPVKCSAGLRERSPKSLDRSEFGLVRIRPLRSDLANSEPWDEGDGFE